MVLTVPKLTFKKRSEIRKNVHKLTKRKKKKIVEPKRTEKIPKIYEFCTPPQ